MRDASDNPSLLDATPSGQVDDGYGYEYLLEGGLFEAPTTATLSYGDEQAVRYRRSTEGTVRIAYFEFPMATVPRETPRKITRAVQRRSRLQYFWFFDPETNRVQVFRTSRGIFQFVYHPQIHTGTTAENKTEKLDAVPEDINVLFDYSAVVDRFYRELWDHRSALAASITIRGRHELSRQAKLLAAQRIIDRLIFLYFLVERGVVVPVNEGGEMAPTQTERVFERLASEHADVWAVLRIIFFERLNDRTNDEVELSSSQKLHVPYLNGGLFDPEAIETEDGTVAEDEQLVVEDFDWDGLVSKLNEYNWALDGLDVTAADDADAAGTLTPEVLGAIYEKFVISVSKIGDDVQLSDLDPEERGDLLSTGNSDVGAYYTGEAITDFKARRALWEGLRAKIDEDIATGDAPTALDPDDLYRPGKEQVEAIESDQQDGFDVLYEAAEGSPVVLDYLDSKLQALRVCDPAIGSGSFALAVANTIFEWRSMCKPGADAFTLRRQILTQNVFGVDVLEGATEICRLRLWLWLLSGTSLDTTAGAPIAGRDGIAPLPDISFNIRTGNSLIGFTDTNAVSHKAQTVDAPAITERLEQYGTDLHDHRTAADPEQGTKCDLEQRHDDLKGDLNEHYAATQHDSDDTPISIADHVESVDAAWDSLHAAPQSSTTLSVEIRDGIPASIDEFLQRQGFTTYKYKARLDRPTLDRDGVQRLFDRLRAHFSDPEAWTVLVEREYAGRDFEDDNLDACHWPLEFPHVFFENGGFDVVISNPPYGASLSPEAAPLLNAEPNYECQGTNDSCEWFYERALDLVADQGVVSYIVTKSIAFYSSWSDLREKLLAETEFKHVFDVGLGFVGVNLETIALITTVGNDGPPSVPTVHRSSDLRSTTTNQPVHLGWVDQAVMLDSNTIIFQPITDEQHDVLDRLRSHDRRLGDVMSTEDTTRQLYIPDSKKEVLEEGDDHYINKNPWVQEFYLADIWHRDLSEYRDAVNRYAVPRVMLKVLRGTRLRAWIDPNGEVVGTEKLVNVPLENSRPAEIAFVYAALNHPCASFYLQKAIFSETTESARVMDGQYSKPIPIPDTDPAVETAVAQLAWTLTLAKQLHHDSSRDRSRAVQTVQSGLTAILGGLYLKLEPATIDRWSDAVTNDTVASDRVRTLFEDFYNERFATRDGRPDQYRDDIEAVLDATVATVAGWDTEQILDAPEMDVIEAVLE